MILNIILVISLAAKCSSMPPTYPDLTKLVQSSETLEFVRKMHPPSDMSKPYLGITNIDETGPISIEGIQYAPLPLEREEETKMVKLYTKVITQTTTTTLEDDDEEEDLSTEPPLKKNNLEPNLESFRGPKVYSPFIPGPNIRVYPYWNSYGMGNSNFAKQNEKLENIFRQYANYETDKKPMYKPKLAIFNQASINTYSNGRQFQTTSTRPTSRIPQRTATRLKLSKLHMNVAREYKLPQISHVAPAAGLLRLVPRPVGILKPGIQESTVTRLRNLYVGRS